MKPLALSGRVADLTWDDGPTHVVLRLCEPGAATGPHDAALVGAPSSGEVFVDTAVVVGGASATARRLVRLGEEFGYLRPGDIIAVHAESKRVRTLYRRASRHNSFLTTERCNHYCLMCSQPPKNADDGWLLDEIEMAVDLVDPATKSLGFTGGEPLLEWRRFMSILAQTREVLPDTAIHVLTNGRGFASPQIADAWAAVAHPNLSAGIPIYAAVDSVHDYVVQAPGAFDETVLGILRLKDRGQRVEIRVVLHSLTAPRIVETATWLARNLPFVDHVALMGLENTGFAIANHDLLWFDPIDYRADLARAVDILDAARIRTSIYNLPYCVLEPAVWPFAAQSISDWKNAYLPECDDCAAKAQCAGFFSTGRPKTSRAIQPLSAPDFARSSADAG
jgi:His-Xaa-Ser system radical SAM maturase HxsC